MLKKIKIEELPALAEICQKYIDDTKTGERTNVTHASAAVILTLQNGNGCLWADSTDNPTCFVYGTVNRRSTLNETAGIIEAIYVSGDCKDKLKRFTEMVKAAETFFKYHKCNVANGSSWVAGGSRDVVKLWERAGYSRQEIITTKTL